MCAIYLGIFVTNGGYHYEEEVESNWFSPMLATKTSRRMAENGGESRSSHAWLTAANDVDWAAWKSCRPILAISTPMDWLMPLFEGYHCQSHHMVMNRREEREVSKREREREIRKKGLRWERERGETSEGRLPFGLAGASLHHCREVQRNSQAGELKQGDVKGGRSPSLLLWLATMAQSDMFNFF